jgi:hypothetical protein
MESYKFKVKNLKIYNNYNLIEEKKEGNIKFFVSLKKFLNKQKIRKKKREVNFYP